MVRTSDWESARTCPSERMTVMRAPPEPISAAQRCKRSRSSVCAEEREGNSGGRVCTNRAMVASCAKVARSESRRNARSAKKSTATSTLASRARNVRASFQKRLRRTSFEQIPCAANRLQMIGIFRITFDFLTQAPDIHIHTARCHESIRPPHCIQKLIPRKNAVWARSKVIEQPEFERAQRNRLSRMANAIRCWINRQFADLDGPRRIRGRFRPPKQRLHPRQQFARAERLRHIVVSAHLKAHNAVGFVPARREHKNGQAIQ